MNLMLASMFEIRFLNFLQGHMEIPLFVTIYMLGG